MSEKISARAARARVTLQVMGMGIVVVRSNLVNVTRHVLVSQHSYSSAFWISRQPLRSKIVGFLATSHDGRAGEDPWLPI